MTFESNRPIRHTLLLFSVAALLVGCGGASKEPTNSIGISPPDALKAPVAKTREQLRSLSETGIGISVAVATAEGTIWSEAHGYADVAEGSPTTPQTRFRIYSIAKPMTAVAAARLMERGQLDPNSPVQAYVPAFPEKAGTITPMHLATHTSGIRHYADETESQSQRHCDSVEDAVAIFSSDPLLHAPGAQETYSSWGYVLLSAVVQDVAGQNFTEALDEVVFKPVGMTNTGLDDPSQPMANRASFFREADNGTIEAAADVDNTCKWGAGGFVSTAEDVARFGVAMVNGSLISDQSLALFLRGNSVYSAQGIGVGGTAFLIVDAEHELAISLLANVTGETLGPALQAIASDLHRSVTAVVGEPVR